MKRHNILRKSRLVLMQGKRVQVAGSVGPVRATADHGGIGGAWRPPAADRGTRMRAPVKGGGGTHFWHAFSETFWASARPRETATLEGCSGKVRHGRGPGPALVRASHRGLWACQRRASRAPRVQAGRGSSLPGARVGHRARALDPDSPPPPLEIGGEVPAIGAEDPGTKSCLPREGVKFFSPRVSILKVLRILRRIQSWRKVMKKNLTLPLRNL